MDRLSLGQERKEELNYLETLENLKASLQAGVQKMSNLESHSAILGQKLNGLHEEISRVENMKQ